MVDQTLEVETVWEIEEDLRGVWLTECPQLRAAGHSHSAKARTRPDAINH